MGSNRSRDGRCRVAVLGKLFTPIVPRSTQPCIPSGSLNRVPASLWVKGGKVTSAGWQVALCDPIWYVISRSGEVKFTNCYILFTFTFTLPCTISLLLRMQTINFFVLKTCLCKIHIVTYHRGVCQSVCLSHDSTH